MANTAAPAVVFIHGAGFDHSVWVMPMRYFARHGYRVIAPDLPAHGASQGTALTSINAIAQWVVAVLDELQIDEAAVVGHSMGSLVAYTLACQAPERVRALALLGTSLPMPVTSLLLDAAEDNHPAAFAMTNTWSHSTQARLGAVGNPGSSVFISAQRRLERMPPGVFHADLTACNSFDIEALPAPKSCATLVVAGANDQMTPAKAGIAVADKLPGALLVTLPNCGHSMMSEQPNAVLDALRQVV